MPDQPLDDGPARHLAGAQFQDGDRRERPGRKADGTSGAHGRRQGTTLKIRSSGPVRAPEGVNRTSSRLCVKIRMYCS